MNMHPWSRLLDLKARQHGLSKTPHAVGMRPVSYGVLASILAIAVTIPAVGSSLQWPSLVVPSNSEHHVGKVVFVELVTPDLASTEQFYTGLFGWAFQNAQSDGRQYGTASANGHIVAELMQKPLSPDAKKRPAWLAFMSVRDVDATERAALQDGAKILFGPRDFPGRGREAVFTDPQGAVFAVLKSSSGDPPDVLAAPGDWIWSALITSNPDTDAAFYQKLFDYDVFDITGDAPEQHLMLASDNYARASANSIPANRPNAHPHWLNFVRVDDATAMSAKVVALGGRVLVEPRIDRHGGMVAIVADPNGTPFGLLEWSETESKVVMP